MIASNFHTHCSFSDGKQDPETIVKKAVQLGFRAIGFSSHAPVPFPNTWAMKEENVAGYLHTIARLKTAYRTRIEIYLGMEIDYFSGDDQTAYGRHGLDYIIGSVHFVTGPRTGARCLVDATPELFAEGLASEFKGDIQAYVRAYYHLVDEMVRRHSPDIVGHFDLVKKFNRAGGYFREDDAWYRETVMPVLRSVAQCGAVLEINTSIRYRDLGDEAYPSLWILRLCRKLKIPIMINSDAHSADMLDAEFAEARSAARSAGYTHQRIMLGGKWTDVEI